MDLEKLEKLLLETLEMVDDQILELRVLGDIHKLQTISGEWILTPLVLARAGILNALANVKLMEKE